MDTARGPVSKVSDEELVKAAASAPNMRALLLALGIAPYGGNYDSVRRRLGRLGGVPPALLSREARSLHCARFTASDELVATAVQEGQSKAAVLRTLGYPTTASMYRALDRRLDAMGVARPDVPRKAWNKGLTLAPRTELSLLLRRGSRTTSHSLRLRLLREGIFEHRCAHCGLTSWGDQPIPLELDHIDGDRSNNELSNLRLLCPNCHALTDTYRGRNVGRRHGPDDAELAHGADLREAARSRLRTILGAA